MKKIYLIHGWGGTGGGGWFDWLKLNLKEKAEVFAFDMPNTNNPKIENWVGYLNKKINKNNLDKETYFIGHSIGCQAIIRYLQQLPEKIKIGGSIFIAGWFNLNGLEDEEKEVARPWLESKIDFKEVKKHCNNFLAIFSDNDPYVPLSDTNLFKEKLGARIIIQKNQGHFDNVNKIEEILNFLEK